MEKEITITWIRHGWTKWNSQQRYLGQTDVSLSQEGRNSLMKKRSEFVMPFNRYFVGNQKRCIETAEILGSSLNWEVIPEWTEIDFGDFEGKNYQELSGKPDYQAWIESNGELPFPGGESRQDFIHRSMQGFHRIEEQLLTEEKILAVVNGGTIMAVLSERSGLPYFHFQVGIEKGYETRWRLCGQRLELLETKEISL